MKTTFLKDYQPPAYLIPEIQLHFSLFEEKTIVEAQMKIEKAQTTAANSPLVLDGEMLELLNIAIDNKELSTADYKKTTDSLTLLSPPTNFTLSIKTELRPQDNKSFVGLYKTKKIFCTQMEAQGFRRVTYFLDRPDVLSKYTTTIEADEKLYPFLLSNGDRINEKKLNNGRHNVTWKDPFPKPCYLFALVAGDLGLVRDNYLTLSGRSVALEIYCDKGNESRCSFAMESLKQSMKWDEDTYQLEYDLNVYMIVAVDDFNMGAMENKGLNIFNSRYVLADEATATDNEALGVQTVIAHEYFHNWSGNRVTCRDWFQLSLKEGLTVFRDQEFSADLNSRGVKRIEDVTNLRTRQFPEDASGMAHPIRPQSYMAIDNFYTRTVYDKGAEVIRMLQTFLGRDVFILGVKKYFSLFDGQAVRTEDFIHALEVSSGKDLSQFQSWYDQAGTPVVKVIENYDAEAKSFTLHLEQTCHHPVTQKENTPYPIPLQYALLDQNGMIQKTKLVLGEESSPGVLSFAKSKEEFIFENVKEKPVLSILRNFSAPVRMQFEQDRKNLLFLMAKDGDAFNRYESAQKLYLQFLLNRLEERKQAAPLKSEEDLLTALRDCLVINDKTDFLFLSKLIGPPPISYFLQFCAAENPQQVERAYTYFISWVQKNLLNDLQRAYEFCLSHKSKNKAEQIGIRALKAVVLQYLTWGTQKESLSLLKNEYNKSTNMTDTMTALALAAHKTDCEEMFSDFANRWHENSLVMNKWFAAQALSLRKDALEKVKELTQHSLFDKTNPNKIYALIYSFISLNPLRFHDMKGLGYQFAANQILDIDQRNPQVAARMATCFNDWSLWHPTLRPLARQEIQRVHSHSGLSKNVYEIMEGALKMDSAT